MSRPVSGSRVASPSRMAFFSCSSLKSVRYARRNLRLSMTRCRRARKSARSKGFTTKSATPVWSASTADESVAYPLMMTTCASRLRSATSCAIERPLPSGRFLSMMSRSYRSTASFWRPAVRDSAGVARKPIPSRTSTTTERTTSSSSTTRARSPSPTLSGIL